MTVCPVPDCKVAYWDAIVRSGAWEGRACSREDARAALSSAELLCRVMHQPPPKPPKPARPSKPAAVPWSKQELQVVAWVARLVKDKAVSYYAAMNNLGAILERHPQSVRAKLRAAVAGLPKTQP